MFGNLLNNKLIEELVDENIIKFIPKLDKSNLQIAQYSLHPLYVRERLNRKKTKLLHEFSVENNSYKIKPNGYVMIDILEQIQLPIGIVGRFIPSSTLIEQGLGLTAGKIEHPFGQNGNRIRFGLKNLLDEPVEILGDERIAYIEFYDLRGMDNFEYKLKSIDKVIYKGRIVDKYNIDETSFHDLEQ